MFQSGTVKLCCLESARKAYLVSIFTGGTPDKFRYRQ